MERFEIKRLAPDNEAASLSVQQSQIWAFSSSLSCLKRHVMCTVCREWDEMMMMNPSFSLPLLMRKDLWRAGEIRWCRLLNMISHLMVIVSTLCGVTSRDYLNGLTCHFCFLVPPLLYGCCSCPRVFCAVLAKLRYSKRSRIISFFFLFFLSYSGFPRVSRGGRKEKKSGTTRPEIFFSFCRWVLCMVFFFFLHGPRMSE